MKEASEQSTDKLDCDLVNGRSAFDRREWSVAYTLLLEADKRDELDPCDLERLAQSAFILGKDRAGADILTRAHKRFLGKGETLSAARCSFWLGFALLFRGEPAQAGGWLSRAARLLESEGDCVEKGYLLLPEGYSAVQFGDPVEGYRKFHEAVQFGQRFNDPDLRTFGLNGQGRALIRQGQTEQGLKFLDEAMVAVTAGEVSPLTAGGIYCSVIEACTDLYDLRRAQEWTDALDRWCSSQSDQLPYRGHCLLHRAEILQYHGSWSEAEEEARAAHQRFLGTNETRLAGAAQYRLAEIHRLQGKLDEADEGYRLAGQCGFDVQPGLAQLRLAQGQTDLASATVRGLASDSRQIRQRIAILASTVEILLVDEDFSSARSAADELMELAEKVNTPLLHAISQRATGAVLLAEDNAGLALAILRKSIETFQGFEAPYEEARVRLLMAQACESLKDRDTALLELEAAQNIFERLGAASDLSRIASHTTEKISDTSSGLTLREIEVLKLIASGLTNRAIASKLFISEKTVARHVSNIFTKLDLSSRAAATAYAYQHKLL